MLSGVLTPSPAGWQQIYVNTGAEQLMGGFLVESPAQPSLVSVCVTGSDPCVSSAQQGASVDVTITGSDLTQLGAGHDRSHSRRRRQCLESDDYQPDHGHGDHRRPATAPVGGNSVP